MAHIDFKFTVTRKALEISRVLDGVAQSNGDWMQLVNPLLVRYFSDNPREAIDGLIEAEIIDPTEDSYFIHE